MTKKIFFSFLGICIVFISSFSQELKLEEIMKGNEFIGHQPENVVWSPDNLTIYFRWNKNNEITAPYYSYHLKTKKVEKLNNEKISLLPIKGFLSDKSNKLILYKNGEAIIHWNEGNPKIIYQSSKYYSIHSILDENRFIIQEENQLYLFHINSNRFIQIINFKKGTEDRKTEKSFLEKQQIELFDFVKENDKKSTDRKEFTEKTNPPKTPVFYMDNKELGWIEVANDLSFIVFRLDQYQKNEPSHYMEYVNESGYAKNKQARPKVGSENPSHELYYLNLNTGESKKIDSKELTGIFQKPAYLKDYGMDINEKYEKPKQIIYTQAKISNNNKNILIEAKSYDNKDRWLAILNPENGKLENKNHQHDEAWIGGPGISGWNMVPGNIGWLNDNQTFYFQSEETGYSHLYTHHVQTNKTDQLTNGKFEIHEAELSKDGKLFFLSSNQNHPGNREFYHLEIASKKMTPVLTETGNHEIYLSPDEKNIALLYSYKNMPWELYVASNTPNAKKEKITTSTSKEFQNYKWREPEIITFQTEDGQTVYARLYKPSKEVKNGAAISFVHGAGYLQNAHNWWSTYYREYMFNNLLCDLGYTVIDIDYRASEGYGSKFRTSIYRHMGGADLKDQLLGRKYLIENENIDSNRIGIYGGSYGGFITLMALFTEPGKFKCGAALRSVTDWAHYNHAYTSNILNTPETDSITYLKSSPIYFAQNLKDRLLILHGVEDDNVQFQDVVRLNQRLIELEIKNFEMAIYPIEPHGFKVTSSWIDEYSRILKMFNEELLIK